jgi:NhaP-type Na+/H+ or K+/H+ antiporter
MGRLLRSYFNAVLWYSFVPFQHLQPILKRQIINQVQIFLFRTVITMLKTIAEGLLFFLLGVFIFNIQSYSLNEGEAAVSSFSLVLLGVGFLALFIGRFLNIYLMSLIGYLIIGKKKWRLNIYEYFILYVSGLVKGAVPFALVLILPQNSTPQTNCVQTSIVFIVYISSLFFNTILPKFLKIQLRCISKLRK